MSTLFQVAAPFALFILVGGGAYATVITIAYLRSRTGTSDQQGQLVDDGADFYRLANQCEYALSEAGSAISEAADKALLKEVYDGLGRIFSGYFMCEHESFMRGLPEGKGLQKMVAMDVRDQLGAAETILARHSNARSQAALSRVRNLRNTLAQTMLIPATR
jgi:hypothetical protein